MMPRHSNSDEGQYRLAQTAFQLRSPDAVAVIRAPYGAGALEVVRDVWHRDAGTRCPDPAPLSELVPKTNSHTIGDHVFVQDADLSGTKAERAVERAIAAAKGRRIVFILRERPDRALRSLGADRAIQHVDIGPRTVGECRGTAGCLLDALFPGRPNGPDSDMIRERHDAQIRIQAAIARFATESAPEGDWRRAVIDGGLRPEPRWQSGSPMPPTLESEVYAATLRDGAIAASLDPDDAFAILAAVAERQGDLANAAALARRASQPPASVFRRIAMLERAGLLASIESLPGDHRLRAIRAPKVFITDPGFASWLARRPEPSAMDLEGLVAASLLAWVNAEPSSRRLLHWRAASGPAVDFILAADGWFVAVNSSFGPTGAAARGLETFRREFGARLLAAVEVRPEPGDPTDGGLCTVPLGLL